MSPQRVRTLRTSTKNARPTAGSREPGEIYVSFPDLQLGVINAAKNAQDLIAVRFFSVATDYAAGDFVIQAGVGYRAKTSITAGAFNATQWDTIATAANAEPIITPGNTSQYWRGDKSWQTLNKTAVGLDQVDNTSDANKPVSSATQAQLNLKAPLASPTFTGAVVAPTPTAGTNNTTVATTAFVASSFAPILSPAFAGNPTAITPSPGDNDTSLATTAFVANAVTTGVSGIVQFPEAPNDGLTYGRKSLAWATIVGGAVVSDTAPVGPNQNGQFWFKSNSGDTFIYVDDGNSQQWVQQNVLPASAQFPVATAQTRNRIVNGAMQISQENGNTAGSTINYYPVDQWFLNFTLTTAVVPVRQFVVPNSATGVIHRIYATVTTADASMTTTKFVILNTKIEGIKVADFGWPATTMPAVLRLTFSAPAGTYSVGLRSGTGDASWLGSFTVTAGEAGLLVTRSFAIPAPTIGTWAIDTSAGMIVHICLAAGPGITGVAGWQTGNWLAAPGQTNGVASTSNAFYLANVGLYLDPQATGVAPAWQMPDEAQELAACQRYYYFDAGPASTAVFRYALAGATNSDAGLISSPVPMRAAPAVSATPTYTNSSAISYLTSGQKDVAARVTVTAAATYRALLANFALNARM